MNLKELSIKIQDLYDDIRIWWSGNRHRLNPPRVRIYGRVERVFGDGRFHVNFSNSMSFGEYGDCYFKDVKGSGFKEGDHIVMVIKKI